MNKLLMLILVFALLTGIASAQEYVTANDFTVTWYDCNYDPTKSGCKVDIQNLAATARDFNLTGLISDTNYDLNVHETQMVIYEWKSSQTEIPVYKNVSINQTCYTHNNETNTSIPYNCSYNQTIQNGTKFVNLAQWKASKTHMLKNPGSVKANYGLINIPKYRSKVKVDDFGTIETINGTKTFKIEWTTPIIKSDRGYGSAGKMAFVDEISNIEYHPWWNSSWSSRIDNAIPNGVRPYQISLNISNSTGTNNATHVFCNGKCNINFTDIRFTLDNTTALPYWIEDNATGKVWVNVTANGTVNLYYGNPSATPASNGEATFIKFHGPTSTEYLDAVQPLTSGIAYETIAKTDNYNSNVWFGISDTMLDSPQDSLYMKIFSDTLYTISWNEGSYTMQYTGGAASSGVYYRLMILRYGSQAVFYKNGVQFMVPITTNLPDEPMGLGMNFADANGGSQLWSFLRYYSIPEPVWATWSIETGQDTTFNQIIYNTGWQTIFINSTQSMTSIRSMMNSSNVLWIARWNATTQKWESYKAGWSYRATNNADAGDAVYLKVANNDTVTRNNGTGYYNWTLSTGYNLIGLDYNGSRTLSQINTSVNNLGTCDADETTYLNPETQVQYTYTCGLTNNESILVNQGEGFWCNATTPISRVRVW